MRHTDSKEQERERPGRTETPDGELLSQIARHDRLALRKLFERYQRRMFVYLARLTRDDRMAEDLVNEVFLVIWRNAGTYRGSSKASTWMFAIAHNKAISALRKRRESQWDEDEAMQIEDPGPDPAQMAESADLARVINSLLDQLSPDHRAVIELTYYQEMSIAEIAEVMNCPANTVKTRMFHARKRLKELLQAVGTTGVEQ